MKSHFLLANVELGQVYQALQQLSRADQKSYLEYTMSKDGKV